MKRAFEDAGVKVLAPMTEDAVNHGDDFVYLATDDVEAPPHRLEMNYMREIRKADFLYIANVDGYVGESAGTEMAYAVLKGLPIVLAEPIQEFSEQIHKEARDVLGSIPVNILPIDDISEDKVTDLRRKVQPQMPSQDQRKILSPLIRVLLRRLKPKPTS